MRSSQWNTFAVVFIILFCVIMGFANMYAGTALLYGASSSSIKSGMFGLAGIFCLGLFWAFLICGWIERKAEQQVIADSILGLAARLGLKKVPKDMEELIHQAEKEGKSKKLIDEILREVKKK